MSTRPWMPFYFADYLADTGHLSTVEHGAYLLLMAHYWAHGGLPSDETTIARITRMTPRQWSQSRDVLRSLFGDGWRHKRIDKEIKQAIEKSNVNSANARRRHSDRTAPAEPTHTQSQSQSQSEERESEARAPEEILVPRESNDVTEGWHLSKSILEANGEDLEDPSWYGFPYTVQCWLNQKIPKDFIIATCTRHRGKNQKYLDKTVQNSWREKQSEPQTPRKTNGSFTGNIIPAQDRILEKLAEFGSPIGANEIRGREGETYVRLLSKG